jgi:hypothetical protein
MPDKTWVAGDVVTAADTNTYLTHTGGEWTAYTPTRAGLTLGNGTEVSRYFVAPRLVVWRYELTFGSTTSVSGDVTLTLPVNAASGATAGTSATPASLVDTGSASYLGVARLASTTTVQIVAQRADATYITSTALSSTVPFTWTNLDAIRFTIVYEGAS